MKIKYAVGVVANCLSLFFLIHPLFLLPKLMSSRYVAHAPYVAMFANAFVWSVFGFLNSDPYLIIVNVIGIFLSIYYIYRLFGVFDLSQRQHVIGFCSVFLFVYLILLVSYFTTVCAILPQSLFSFWSGFPEIQYFGFLSALVSISLFASPLVTLNKVFQQKSTDTLSFPLSMAMFFLASSYVVYGVLEYNLSIFVPNFLGLILSIVQLLLFVIFPQKQSDSTNPNVEILSQ